MSKISFFYDKDVVCKVSLKALEKRNFIVEEFDKSTGRIIACSKKQFLKPEIRIEIQVDDINKNQTSIKINSEFKKNWFINKNIKTKEEQKLINTLYKCFDSI
ncbi:MAG: hypothetical protein ACK5B3_01545 [Bacteroidota bacterium]|jgi:hypothetical protein